MFYCILSSHPASDWHLEKAGDELGSCKKMNLALSNMVQCRALRLSKLQNSYSKTYFPLCWLSLKAGEHVMKGKE